MGSRGLDVVVLVSASGTGTGSTTGGVSRFVYARTGFEKISISCIYAREEPQHVDRRGTAFRGYWYWSSTSTTSYPQAHVAFPDHNDQTKANLSRP